MPKLVLHSVENEHEVMSIMRKKCSKTHNVEKIFFERILKRAILCKCYIIKSFVCNTINMVTEHYG